MFNDVFINELVPRKKNELSFSLNNGKRLFLVFGIFFLIASIFFFIVAAFTINFVFPFIAISFITVISLLLLNQWKKSLKQRSNTYINGKAIKAKVLLHSRTFTLFNGRNRSYVIKIGYKNELGSTQMKYITHRSKDLWKTAPLNSIILGLKHNKNTLFGEELGCSFKIKHK